MDFMESFFAGKSRHGPLYKPARLIAGLVEKLEKKRGRDSSRALDVLTGMYGAVQGRKKYREYQILKIEKMLTFLSVGFGLAAVMGICTLINSQKEGIHELKRPASGEGSQVYELNAQMGDQILKGIVVEVPEKSLSKAECCALLAAAEEELNLRILEEGWNFDAVSEDLLLPEVLQDGLVDVRWNSSNYDLLEGSGQVHNELVEEDGELLYLEAELSCMDQEKILMYPVRVVPKGNDTASRLARETARKIAEEETERESEIFVLPDEYEGEKISWQLAEPHWCAWIAGITAFGCLALQAAFERDLIREGERRQKTLAEEYPAFLARLTLLAGTGMPIRKVFVRLAKESGKQDSLQVYQEVLKTVREMESGVTELAAYENFGRRCRLSQYRKCASLLSQNVRKGTGGLLAALNEEAVNAFEERKALARKKGEEAQTKLLLPMVMMLVVVMILAVVPAWLSFGGI